MSRRAGVSAEFKVFTGLTLFVGIVVVTIVGYAIYQQPADPRTAGTATIVVAGEPGIRFEGTVGALADTHVVEGTTPFRFEARFKHLDHVAAAIQKVEGGRMLKARILMEKKTVDKDHTDAPFGRVALLWKAPRER